MLAALFLILAAVPAAAPEEGGRPQTQSWVHDALSRALEASADIGDSFHRAQALAEISEAQAAAGDLVAARAALAQAVAVTRNISKDEEALRSWALQDIGLAYVKADDLAAAEATAETIRDLRLHDNVLVAVVDARRGARDVAGAQATARRIKDAVRQGQSLRTIAILQASENDFTSALTTARSIQQSTVHSLALGDIAAAMAREGNFDEARSLVVRIRDGQSRARAFVELAAAQAGNGDTKGALATVEQIEDKLARADALARVASVRASSSPAASREMFAQAFALATSARGGASRKCDTLLDIALSQLAGGDVSGSAATLKRAFNELRTIKDDREQLTFLSRLAPLQARAGDFEGAFATAMRAEDRSLRPLLVRDIAASQAERGDVAGAVARARSLDDRPAAAAALFGVLRVQSQTRDNAGMLETIGVTLQAVRFIGNAELRAGALGSLAATQALQGNIEQAQALFTEAMNTAAALDGSQQRAAGYARIADSLADRHRAFSD